MSASSFKRLKSSLRSYAWVKGFDVMLSAPNSNIHISRIRHDTPQQSYDPEDALCNPNACRLAAVRLQGNLALSSFDKIRTTPGPKHFANSNMSSITDVPTISPLYFYVNYFLISATLLELFAHGVYPLKYFSSRGKSPK